jgi:hypothetical protein
MWVDGCGGNPGPVDFEGNLLKGSRGVESYFGGLQKIMAGDDAHCEVVLARGQHNLQGTRSYLCLYPNDMALDNWLEPARHWNTFEAMGMLKRHAVVIAFIYQCTPYPYTFTINYYCHNNLLLSQ